ncbi:exocyst complex component Sec10-domain-containing protein [Lipomyces arxii]|uniref:exocyst complex component Sec10-domain-containing protein n=1 Tax=Lipomyces arxii TaxID=56418 RepID=UPI0034CDE64F
MSAGIKKQSGPEYYAGTGAAPASQSPYSNTSYSSYGTGNASHSYPSNNSNSDAVQDLSIEDAKMFVNWLAESVKRVAELSSQIEVPQYAKELLLVLINALGTSYVEVALTHAMERIQSEKPTAEMSEFIDNTVRLTSDILQLISNAANKHLMVLASDSSTIRKDMSQILMDYVAQIERRVEILEESGTQQAPVPTKKRWEKITKW